MATDERTRAYVARKLAEGKTKWEAAGMSRDAMAVAVGATRRRLELAEYGR